MLVLVLHSVYVRMEFMMNKFPMSNIPKYTLIYSRNHSYIPMHALNIHVIVVVNDGDFFLSARLFVLLSSRVHLFFANSVAIFQHCR